MTTSPSPNGANGEGRDRRGRFSRGNPGGPGNPYAKHVGAIRKALAGAVTGKDVRQIVAALVEKAKAGDVIAAREVFDRILGRPLPADIEQRIAELEHWLQENEL